MNETCKLKICSKYFLLYLFIPPPQAARKRLDSLTLFHSVSAHLPKQITAHLTRKKKNISRLACPREKEAEVTTRTTTRPPYQHPKQPIHRQHNHHDEEKNQDLHRPRRWMPPQQLHQPCRGQQQRRQTKLLCSH